MNLLICLERFKYHGGIENSDIRFSLKNEHPLTIPLEFELLKDLMVDPESSVPKSINLLGYGSL
jgi:hypothetical protein